MTDIVYRARQYWFHHKSQTWYEPCPVIKRTQKFVVVESGDFPDSPLYRGGTFHLNAQQMRETGKAYHSRHGEYFYLEKPEVGALFPSKELLATPDWVTLEAQVLGWDTTIPRHEWAEWQKDCFLVASTLKLPLREVVNFWKSGRLGELFQLLQRKLWTLDGLFDRDEPTE